jgi:hypothetical protein
MRKKEMFVLIGTAVKKLQREASVTEDVATGLILEGLKSMPDELVMDLDLLPSILQGIIEMNSGSWKLN